MYLNTYLVIQLSTSQSDEATTWSNRRRVGGGSRPTVDTPAQTPPQLLVMIYINRLPRRPLKSLRLNQYSSVLEFDPALRPLRSEAPTRELMEGVIPGLFP